MQNALVMFDRKTTKLCFTLNECGIGFESENYKVCYQDGIVHHIQIRFDIENLNLHCDTNSIGFAVRQRPVKNKWRMVYNCDFDLLHIRLSQSHIISKSMAFPRRKMCDNMKKYVERAKMPSKALWMMLLSSKVSKKQIFSSQKQHQFDLLSH